MRYVESINKSLFHLLDNDKNIIILGEDIIDPYGGAFKVTKGLSTEFPGRVLNTPISEAAITGFATGLAMRGLKPILEIMFGDFITLCTDQIINGATKFSWMYGDRFNTPLFLRTPMGGGRGYGATHSQTLETIYLGVPNLSIVAPSRIHDPGEILISIMTEIINPTLFIENKLLYPKNIVGPNKTMVDNFFINQIKIFNQNFPTVSLQLDNNSNPDITLITYGRMPDIAMQVAKKYFIEEEILIEILIPSLLKPFPIDDLMESVNNSGRVIILEEGIKTSGWGAEIANRIYTNNFSTLKHPIILLGAESLPIPSSIVLEDMVLPNNFKIENAVRTILQ